MRAWWLIPLVGLSIWAAEARWLRLKSPNFEMYTTASERNARETLKYFEQVRAFFVQAMGGIPGRALPVRIVAFNSKKEYEPYAINNFATAFYHSTSTSDDIVLSESGFDVFPVAVHEYVHLVAKHAGLGNLPPWLNEGLAEVYSTMKQVTGDRLLVGEIPLGRFQALQREKWVPLRAIVTATRDSPYYNEKNQAGSLYNESWALVHMMFLTPSYRPQFSKFVTLINSGTSTEEALTKTYGKTIEQLEADLQGYLRSTQFKGALFASKVDKSGEEITAAPASTFDVKLVLTELTSKPGKEIETQRSLEELTAQDPKRPEPLSL